MKVRHFFIPPAFLFLTAVAHAQPPSAIPEDARRDFVQANIRFKEAQSPADYQQAVDLYGQALAIAPRFGNAWYNLSKAQEKLERYDDAIASLKHFIADSPNDPDVRAAQDHEYELEIKRDDHSKAIAAAQQAEAERAARLRDAEEKVRYLRQLLEGLVQQTTALCHSSQVWSGQAGPGPVPVSCTDGEAEGTNWEEFSDSHGALTVNLSSNNDDKIEIGRDGKAFLCIPASNYNSFQTVFINQNLGCGNKSDFYSKISLKAMWEGKRALYMENCVYEISQDCSHKQRRYLVFSSR